MEHNDGAVASATEHRQRKLAQTLGQLSDAYDDQARLNRATGEKDWTANQKRIAKLESTVVALTRPRHWRLRDLRTGGIRDLEAVGVELREGELSYGDQSWPATWSFASISPGKEAIMRHLSIGRVTLRSPVPLRKKVEADRWVIEVPTEDLLPALVLTACINVSSRLRAATFPAGTYF